MPAAPSPPQTATPFRIPGAVPALLLLCWLPTAARAQAGLPGDEARAAWTELVGFWEAEVERAGIVGASLAVVDDGRIAARAHSGMADLARDRPVDAATLFHWASITKTFTGVAILQLRDRGLLDLDDPVVRWVPELRGVHNSFGSMEEVTLRHLLSHSAGFRGSTWPWDGGEPWQPWEPTRWDELAAMMPWTRIEFEPGSRFQYSNPGIVFLGRVVEAVTGDVYEAYVEKNVFRPLGMETAYFDVAPWHLAEHRSENYRVEGGEPVANGDFNTGITVSNGGLNGTVGDLARWIAFLTGRAEGDAARGVLSRASLEEMWDEVVPIREMELGHEGMGLTFFLYPDRGLVGHTGSQRSFFSFILFDPDGGRGIIAAFNTAGGDENGPDTRGVINRVREQAARLLLSGSGGPG
ncbi:MAG TPA: serine hydrolase domain-containing protein [Longimicrobiales bacterium]|nr:serine hydrolase domain-containing protein [Longimicrobiales bacterium]